MSNLKKLYDAMSDKFDVGDYNSFEQKMQTPEDRKRFYDAVSQKGFDLGDYNSYESRLSASDVKKKETADLKSEGSLSQSPVSNGQSKSASPSSETSSAEKRVVNPENKPIMTTFAPKPAGKVWENPFANSFLYKKEKPDTKNPLGKGTVVEQPKENSTKKKDENPYAVDVTAKSDNAKTQIKEKAQIQQDIQTGELEKRNPTSYIGASTLYAEKAAEITGKSDTKGLLEYSKTIGVDDDLTDRLPDFDKKILANNQKLKDLYAQLEIAQKSGNEQNIKDAQKRISEGEKANSSLLVIRNKDIDTQILAIQKQLDSGTKKVENYLESAPSGNMYGTMSTTPQVKYVPLTEQEKAQMKSQIKSLEKRKGAYLQDVTDEQAVFTDLKPKIKLYEDKNIIPKDAGTIDKLRIYYGIKLIQLRKLKERLDSENGSPLFQDNPILSGLGVSTKEFGKEVVKSVKQRVFDDKTTKEIMEIEGELNAIAPIVALNLDPNIKSSGFWKTFGTKTFDAITQTTKTGNTKQETAAYVQKATQDAGVTLTSDRKSELATQLQNKDIGQRSEKIGQGLGSTVGFAVDFAATMPLSGAIIGKAAKLAQVLSPKTRAGIGIIESALNETRLGRLAVNMTDEGLKYSVSGQLNEVIKDDATLSQGALGAAGSKLGEKAIQPIASLFGKNAGKFISLMGDTFGRSIVELSEEVSQNTGALVNEVSGKDSFIKGVIELFNDSEKGAQFTKSLKEQYGDMEESVDFAIQIFAMSTAFNVGKFGKFFKELAFKKRDTLSETGKEKFDAVVNDLESEVVQAAQKAADDMKQNEGITVEDIVTDMDKAERESLEDVGDAEYKAFVDSGTVAPERLNSIAEKAKDGIANLSEKEVEIYYAKKTEIEDIIKTGVAPESSMAQEAAATSQENQTTENTDGKENATTPTESTDTGQEQNVSTGVQQSDSNNGEVQQGDGTAAETGQQPEVEQQQAEPQQTVDKKQKAASLIQQLGLPKKQKVAEVTPEAAPTQQPMSAESTDVQDMSKKGEEIDKGDVSQGKVGNTEYEVKTDGVYFKGNKLDNPKNLSHKELIEGDIRRRQEEELGTRESRELVTEDGVKFNVEIHTTGAKKIVTVTNLETKGSYKNTYSTELSNDKIYETEGASGEYSTEAKKVESRGGKLTDSINAKYDAELKAVESLLSKEQSTSTTQSESNPALRDVGSTAKALENKIEVTRTKDGFVGDFLNDYELIGEGSEHTVYRSKDGSHVIRISEPYNDKSESTLNVRVRDAMLISEIIGDGSLEVIGYYESENGTKNPIYKQNFQEGTAISEQEAISYLQSIGAIEYGDKYNRGYLINYEGKWYKISDLTDNFFRNKNGEINAIDAAIQEISQKVISEAYHKAKADGSNPELVKAVESLLSKEQSTSTTQSESNPALRDVESTAKALDAKKADIKKDRYYNSPANRMVRVQKESQNTDVTQEEIDEIETIIEKAKELGWDKNRLFRQLTSMGYSYALGVNPEAFKNYLEDRLSGKTNIKVTNEYNFFKQLDAELKALEQSTSTNQSESNPALRDVESTAKALEGVDKDPITKSISGIPLPPLEIGGYKRKPTEQYNINDPQSISEAYHKAKADGSNPELVKAVEGLLGKPTEKVEEKVKPIRQLGTGSNVYFETPKYRVNDFKGGKVLLNLNGDEDGGMAISNIEFDNVNEAVKVAEILQQDFPNGIPNYIDAEKYVQATRQQLSNANPIPPNKVNQPVQQDVATAEQQGNQTAVQQSPDATGQGNAEAAATDVEGNWTNETQLQVVDRVTQQVDKNVENETDGNSMQTHIDKDGVPIDVYLRKENNRYNWYYDKAKKPFATFNNSKDAVIYIMEQPFWYDGELNKKGRISKYAQDAMAKTAQDSQENIKLAQDGNEQQLAEQKLTEQDNIEQEPNIKIIEGKAESDSKVELAEAIKQADELINIATEVVVLPISEIKTNTLVYQGRKREYSERSANNVANTFDKNKFDPIVVYRHPDGNTYVLSGHSRLEGMKRRGATEIPTRVFEGTPESARIFALNSNKLGTLQTELENAEYYREKLKKGESYNSVLTEAKENEQPGSAKRVVDIAHLNPEGKAILALEAMEEAEGDNKSRITQIAQKIGALRSKFDFLTDAHENELFDYFMDNKDVPSDRDINDPKNQISRSIGAVKYDTSQPLNLKSIKVKSDVRVEWEQKRDELTQQIADIKKEVNPSKKTGWTGLKEKLIASIAKGKSEEAINQAEADFNNNKNGVKDVYLKLLDRKRDELRAASDKLAKHLLQEKNLIEGEKNQQVLFLISGEKGVSAQTQEADIRLKNLEVARDMEAEGKSPLEIKVATGWERGADGLWNYEVMDGELKDLKGLKGENKLSDVLDNDQLFEMYPEMKDAIVVIAPLNDASGTFSKEYDMDSGKEVMVFKVDESLVGDKAKFKSVLLHEIQHGIQDIEGFSKGGNTEQFNDTTDVDAWWNDEGGANEDIPFNELTPKQQQDAVQRYMDEVGDAESFDKYRKVAGEVQARNVESRMGMTPEQRKNTLLESTEDVSRKDQTFLRDNASDMQSVSASSNFQTITKAAFDNLMEKLKKAFPSVKVFSDEKTLKEKLKQYGVDVAEFMTVVYHGSPYSFDKFSLDKIGTGEGAQAFGWGLYFTDLEDIARGYAERLGGSELLVDGKVVKRNDGFEVFTAANGVATYGYERALERNMKLLNEGYLDSSTMNKVIDEIKKLKDKKVEFKKKGITYRVTLHKGKTPEQYTWLEWDKPVSENQKKQIKDQAKKENLKDRWGRTVNDEGYYPNSIPFSSGMDGDGIYNLLQNEFNLTPKEASLFLLRAGIDGIKYPAESISRGATSDTAKVFNYVVFDENAVEIEEKVQFLRTQSGTIYGAKFPDGTIYINTDNLNANTPIHEYGHIWQSVFPMEFKKGIELLKLSPQGRALIKKTAENPAYKGKPIEDIEAEALVTAIGNKGETIFNSNPSFFKKFKEWMSDFFKTIGDKLGIRDLSADEMLDRFTKKVVGDLLGEKVLSEAIDGISGTDLQSIEDSKLKSLIDTFKDNGFTYDEMIEALEENEVDYDEAQVKDAWGAGVPPVNTDTEVITTDGKTRKKALLYKAHNGESNPDMKAAIEQHNLDYIVENQNDVIKAVNDTIETYGIDAAFEQARKNPLKGAADAVIYDAKLRKIQDEMATAQGAKYDELVTEMALIYKEMDEIAREAGRFSSMLHKIYQTSDLAYAYARQKELYEKATGKPIPADIELKFKELADTIKKADSRIAELEKEKKEIEDKYRDAKAKEEVDILIKEAYEKGKKDGSFGKDTAKDRKRMERAKAKIAEGLEDVMKGLGLIQMAEGTNRPSMVKGFVRMGQGLIDAGIATAENVYDKIKEEIEKAAKKSVDISSFKDDIEKAFNEPKKLKVPNSRVRELIQNGANTIEEVVDGLKEEYPDKTDREIRDGVSGYGDVKPTNDDPIEAKLRRMKRIGRYMSALEDLNANKRPSRSGQQRDELDPEERAMLKEIREKLKNLPLDDADLSKKLKTAQDAIEARTRNAIEDIQRQIDMIQSGMKPGEVLTRNTKTPITDKIQELKDELKAKKEELRMLREASKLEDTIQELKDMAAITGERNIPKKAVEDGLIQDLVQAHIEKGTPLDKVQEQVFTQLKGIFPEATDSDIRNAILRQGRFKKEAKEISEFRKKENELAKQLRLKEEIEKLEKGIVSISKQRGADSAEVQDLRQRLKAKKEEAINTNVNVSIKDLERQIANVKRSKTEVLRKLAAKEFEKKVKMKKQFTNDPAWKAKHAELRKEKLERIKAKHDFDKAQEKARMEQRSKGRILYDTFIDLLGLPKALRATIDLSAPLRQGIITGLYNPKEFGRATWNMFRFIKKSNFDKFMNEIRTNEDFYVISQSGLAITDPSGKAAAQEDVFMNNFARLWGYNFPYNASERAYSGFLNAIRVEVFLKGVAHLEAQGFTFENDPEQFKALARVINNQTGRGGLGNAEAMAKELGLVFFSARMVTSRFGAVADAVRPDTPAYARKQALKGIASMVAYNATLIALGTYAIQAIKSDDDDDYIKIYRKAIRELEKHALNPVHTDFLKVKYGNTRYDFTAGYSSLMRLVFRIALGKSTRTDKYGQEVTENLREKGFNSSTSGSEIAKIVKNKLSPQAKVVYSLAVNEDVDDPYKKFNWGNAGKSLAIPLSLDAAFGSDNFEWEIDEHDREGVPFINVEPKKSGDVVKRPVKYGIDQGLSGFGVSVQNY